MQGKGVWVSSMGVPQDEKFSKFFGPKKNWAGGVLRERGLGTYTLPTLRI